jgi:cephalosporin-C deacetylase
MALAAGSLLTDVAAVLPDVPFLCDIRRAVDVAQEEPILELVRYLAVHRDQVDATFATLAYFDLAILGRWATAPSLFSVALMDRVCPPSTVYAAYNAYGGETKQIREYPFNDHEGGGMFQRVEQLRWLDALLAR